MRSIVAAVAAVVFAAAGSGCGDRGDDPVPLAAGTPTPSPAVSPTPRADIDLNPAEAAAVEEMREVYQRFLDLEVELAADPPPPAESDERLNEVLTGALHGRVLISMHMLHDHGLARRSAPESRVRVTRIDLDAPVPEATFLDCLDTTGWPLVDRRGEPVPDAQAPPEIYGVEPGVYARTVHVKRYGDGRWYFHDYDRHQFNRPLPYETDEGEARC
jgi:hypothetical protein